MNTRKFLIQIYTSRDINSFGSLTEEFTNVSFIISNDLNISSTAPILVIIDNIVSDNIINKLISSDILFWVLDDSKYITSANDVLPQKFTLNYLISKLKVYFHNYGNEVFVNRVILQLANEISNSVIICDSDGHLIWTNKGFKRIYECTQSEYEDKFGKSILDFSVHDDIIDKIDQVKSSKQTIEYFTNIVTKNGTKKWLQTNLSPIYKGEKLLWIVAIESDISELKNVQEDLETQRKSMQETSDFLKDANHELEAQRDELNMKHQELMEEKKHSDELLNNILPEVVAHQLKKGKKKTKRYKSTTILFSDFKGFSKLCKKHDPAEIVSILDELFSAFDTIIEKHFIEKIKTIGDAYMCAGGLPMKNNSHAFNVVLAALEFQQYLFEFNKPRMLNLETTWECRIGIHTGEVFAGVVGKKKFAYDIWGDSVNIAARMEQNGAVNTVNVSETTYERIKNYFECIPRGKIEAKNIGAVDMFFVSRLLPKYSADEMGYIPNQEFTSMLNKL